MPPPTTSNRYDESASRTNGHDLKAALASRTFDIEGMTIDGVDSRDLDDGLTYQRDGSGHSVTVSIAAVGAFLSPESELAREAEAKGFTRYLAGSNRPMLPRHISEGVMSLLPGEPRPALGVRIGFSSTFELGAVEIVRPRFRNIERFTYHSATAAIGHHDGITALFRIAEALLDRRRLGGAFTFSNPQKGLLSDEEGRILKSSRQTAPAQLLIQEFMILTNVLVAEYCDRNHLPCMARNHGAREDVERDAALEQITRLLDAEQGEKAAEKLRALCQGEGRAKYETAFRGHFALNIPRYLHFTSPIRRFADLENHWSIEAHLAGNASPRSAERMAFVAEYLNRQRAAWDEASTSHHREREQSNALVAVSNVGLGDLSAKRFDTLVSLQLKEASCLSGFPAELMARLLKSRPRVKQIVTILNESPTESVDWRSIRTHLYELLRRSPRAAREVLHSICQVADALPIRTKVERQGEQTIATLYVDFRGKTLETTPTAGTNEQDALPLAQLKLLFQVFHSMRPNEVSPETTLLDSDASRWNLAGSCRTELYEIAAQSARKGVQRPNFQVVKQSGSKELPQFTVRASIVIGTAEWNRDGVGASRDEAEDAAADRLLREIKGRFPRIFGPQPNSRQPAGKEAGLAQRASAVSGEHATIELPLDFPNHICELHHRFGSYRQAVNHWTAHARGRIWEAPTIKIVPRHGGPGFDGTASVVVDEKRYEGAASQATRNDTAELTCLALLLKLHETKLLDHPNLVNGVANIPAMKLGKVHLGLAKTKLFHVVSLLAGTEPNVTVRDIGSAALPSFEATASCTIGEGRFSSASTKESNKKSAEGLACLAVLRELRAVGFVSFDDEETVAVSPTVLDSSSPSVISLPVRPPISGIEVVELIWPTAVNVLPHRLPAEWLGPQESVRMVKHGAYVHYIMRTSVYSPEGNEVVAPSVRGFPLEFVRAASYAALGKELMDIRALDTEAFNMPADIPSRPVIPAGTGEDSRSSLSQIARLDPTRSLPRYSWAEILSRHSPMAAATVGWDVEGAPITTALRTARTADEAREQAAAELLMTYDASHVMSESQDISSGTPLTAQSQVALRTFQAGRIPNKFQELHLLVELFALGTLRLESHPSGNDSRILKSLVLETPTDLFTSGIVGGNNERDTAIETVTHLSSALRGALERGDTRFSVFTADMQSGLRQLCRALDLTPPVFRVRNFGNGKDKRLEIGGSIFLPTGIELSAQDLAAKQSAGVRTVSAQLMSLVLYVYWARNSGTIRSTYEIPIKSDVVPMEPGRIPSRPDLDHIHT